ncbi:hypothetical protein M0C34_15990 [Agarivorans sp. TSD2052]|uniref:hypothetical protein n=1 Tax=Agarivorans sp. TSD2052 TaxID=2937286 RepID=UPI00200BB5F0|nr:hypothetical protein [Agarivorans sp. TSD2052]UPW17729.1 hypothetical protein M0C34_15990 [Agarivorans sp. TSD2052]
MKQRYVVYGLFLVFFTVATAEAAECPSNKIKKLRAECQEILRDISGTRSLARQAEDKAFEVGLKAGAKGTSCLISSGKLISSCYTGSPSCLTEIVKAPNTVKKCVDAIKLIDTSITYYQKSKLFIGTALVAFSDQGGDSIIKQLSDCGAAGCEDYSTLIIRLKNDQARVSRNIKRLERYRELLMSSKTKLEKCEANKGKGCEKASPSLKNMDSLEPPTDDTQPETVPLDLALVSISSSSKFQKAAPELLAPPAAITK